MPRGGGWRERIESMGPGEHFLLWTDGLSASAPVAERFIRGGLSRGDLVAIATHPAELETLRRDLALQGLDLDDLARGNQLFVVTEDWSVDEPPSEGRVKSLFDRLHAAATERHSPGLSLLGRLAPRAFEDGDVHTSWMLERACHSRRGSTRTLCPYDRSALTLRRFEEASTLLPFHTHTMTATDPGRYLIEAVR
jgi:hypothetical protein